MRANSSMYAAALHLYGALREHGGQDEWLEPLTQAAGKLYALAGRSGRGGDDAALRLQDLAAATHECMDLLGAADVELPVVRWAWSCLRTVIEELESELEDLPPSGVN
jgi:hypothetical protein